MCMTNRPPPKKRPGRGSGEAPGPGCSDGDGIDYNRVVWDPDYRKSVIRRLKRQANDNDPAEDG
jgi:hypothetical protein